MPQWEAKEEASETWATNMVKDNFPEELEVSSAPKDQPLEKVKKASRKESVLEKKATEL